MGPLPREIRGEARFVWPGQRPTAEQWKKAGSSEAYLRSSILQLHYQEGPYSPLAFQASLLKDKVSVGTEQLGSLRHIAFQDFCQNLYILEHEVMR